MRRPHDQAIFLRLLLGALGLGAASAACGGTAVVEDPGAAGGGGAGATATSSATSTTGTTSGATTATSSTTGGGGAGGCPLPSSQTDIQPPATGPCAGFYAASYVCFPEPEAPATCDQVYSMECVLEAYACGLQGIGDAACGPDPGAPGACCYVVVGDCPVGRPFLVDGAARVAARVGRDDWTAAVAPDVEGLDPESRAALADYWGREALSEHASVASFARFVLELLAVGAPSELVADAQRALADEIAHAQLAFGLSSAYHGSPQGPSPLDVTGALEGGGLLAMAVAVAREGCIAETVAALQVAAARDAASDPVVREVLAVVAEQEQAHALLAWRTLAFCLARGDHALRTAVTAVFASAERHVGLGPVPVGAGEKALLRAHGCLPLEERRALAREALAHVIAPAARSLLAAPIANGAHAVPLCGRAVTPEGRRRELTT